MRVMEIREAWDFDHLALGERDQPQAGPGEIVCRMLAASLNYRDYLMVQGGYGRAAGALPLVPISDGVGEVVSLGDDVDRFAVGDRVTPIFFQGWHDGPPSEANYARALGGPVDGVMQEFMRLPAADAVRAPANLDDLQAAALPCAGVTAWNAVVEQGQVKPGDKVLIQGSGGVSVFALLFAKAMGAEVIATSSSAAKLERLQAMGADHLINYREVEKWGGQAREIAGSGVDLVVEVGGAGTMQQSIRATKIGGTIATIGVLSGVGGDLNLAHVVMTNMRLQGITVGSRTMHEAMADAIEKHHLAPPVDDQVFGFDDLVPALKSMPKGGHFGKICLRF